MDAIDLTPAPRREMKALRARILRWATGLSAYATVVLFTCLFFASRCAGVNSALAATSAELDVSIKATTELMLATDERLTDARGKLKAVRSLGRQPDWQVPLTILAKTLGDEVVLERCWLEATKATSPEAGRGASAESAGKGSPPYRAPTHFLMELSGFARSQEAVSQFVLRLEGVGLFKDVTLVQTTRQPFLDRQAIAFQVKCLLGQDDDGAL